MLQQINLYQYLVKPARLFLNMNIILLCYLFFTILLFIGTIFDLKKNNTLEEKHKQLIVTMDNENAKLTRIKAAYPLVNLADLEGSVKRLKDDLKAKNAIFSMLSRRKVFSDYLTALGKATMPLVWLTDIEISDHGNTLILKGQTNKAVLLHSYMERLHKDSLFSKMNFQLEEVAQTVENKKVAPFSTFNIVGKNEGIS